MVKLKSLNKIAQIVVFSSLINEQRKFNNLSKKIILPISQILLQ